MPVDSETRASRSASVLLRPFRSAAVIGIYVLPDQRHVAHAGIGKAPDLGGDFFHRPRNFHAARIGHDAECAELVAAFLHGHKSRHAAAPRRGNRRRRHVIELFFRGKFGFHHRFAVERAGGEGREPVQALRPDDDIDDGRAPQNLFAFRLGDASGNDNDHAPALGLGSLLHQPHAAELRIDLVRGLLADVAGIENEKVGVLGHPRFPHSLHAPSCPPYESSRRRSSGSRRI
jgi:hypothetical protein